MPDQILRMALRIKRHMPIPYRVHEAETAPYSPVHRCEKRSSYSAAASISDSNSAFALIGRAKYHQFSSAVQPSSSATSSPHKQTSVGAVRLRIFSSARSSL